ncbi:hypothetical protein pEaSNUABM52_00246 [Erwinia phage pEp_SNUABM_52]|nr:hypothetical protein pEaSNUABM52_00246 [Erwinia phage pEp_SNUABM_52]
MSKTYLADIGNLGLIKLAINADVRPLNIETLKELDSADLPTDLNRVYIVGANVAPAMFTELESYIDPSELVADVEKGNIGKLFNRDVIRSEQVDPDMLALVLLFSPNNDSEALEVLGFAAVKINL